MQRTTRIPVLALALAVLTSAVPASAGEGRADLLDYRATDVEGVVHRFGVDGGPRPVVAVFLDTTCPIANRYAPRLNELHRAAREAGFEFYGVISDPAVTPRAARAHGEQYGLEFPVLFDASGELAARLQPTHVPEAFLVDAEDRLVYRGRIDDRFEAVGRLRQKVTSHDLLAAIEAVAGGSEPETARTEPVGCVFEAWDSRETAAGVTYTRDVAPILNANCVDCHRAGDVGPFPLQTHADARRRARMIAQVCGDRTMPPWRAVPGHGSFRDERVLSERQIALLQEWAEAGAPEGDPEQLLPAPPVPETRWRLGEPDLLVPMPVDYEVPAEGADIYRYFVVPSTLTEDRTVVAMDFRPGDPAVVHHAIVYVDREGWAREEDARDPEPGFSVFRDEGEEAGGIDDDVLFDIETIAGWAPGAQPYALPRGLGMRLAAGGDFVIEVHYHLNGKRTTDRSTLALYFADEPVDAHVEGLVIGTENIDIPPGEPGYRRHVWMKLPTAVDVIDVSPHMHYLGKGVEAVATLPDGTREPLIRIDDWDFRWQDTYVYREPVHLPRGTRIDATFRFDNSAENPFNPSSPPIRVKEGWQTTDEMCLLYLTVVPGDPSDLQALYMAMIASFLRTGDP